MAENWQKIGRKVDKNYYTIEMTIHSEQNKPWFHSRGFLRAQGRAEYVPTDTGRDRQDIDFMGDVAPGGNIDNYYCDLEAVGGELN